MNKLLPYETIVKAHEGDPDAIDTVLSHYAGYTEVGVGGGVPGGHRGAESYGREQVRRI